MTEWFEDYGNLAASDLTPTEMSGRYPIHEEAERLIFRDVVQKLTVSPEDEVLDIGCGVGLLLIPLSFIAKHVAGVDHPKVLEVVRQRGTQANIELIGSDFMGADLTGRSFDKILCYGVVQNLLENEELDLWLEKALSLLRPRGKMLLGDIPNICKKSRFQNSYSGEIFERSWKLRNQGAFKTNPGRKKSWAERIEFNDETVSDLMLSVRRSGFETYLLPQPEDLPWGRTREDLLIYRHG